MSLDKTNGPILVLGRDTKEGFVVTDVICSSFPELTADELAELSRKLSEWSQYARRDINELRIEKHGG